MYVHSIHPQRRVQVRNIVSFGFDAIPVVKSIAGAVSKALHNLGNKISLVVRVYTINVKACSAIIRLHSTIFSRHNLTFCK